jgi:hypothetical protein
VGSSADVMLAMAVWLLRGDQHGDNALKTPSDTLGGLDGQNSLTIRIKTREGHIFRQHFFAAVKWSGLVSYTTCCPVVGSGVKRLGRLKHTSEVGSPLAGQPCRLPFWEVRDAPQ